MMTAIAVDNLLTLLEAGVRTGDETAIAAAHEWLLAKAAVAQMAHIMMHIDQAVVDQAAEEAMKCGGADKQDLH